jgi:hypothetical protein
MLATAGLYPGRQPTGQCRQRAVAVSRQEFDQQLDELKAAGWPTLMTGQVGESL